MTTHTITLNVNLTDDQQELSAYRNIGSIRYLRRLRMREIRRRRLLNRIERITKQVLFCLLNAVIGSIIVFDIWLVLSYIDVVLHNLDPNPVYQFWNIFNLI